MTDLSKLQLRAHEIAVDHGWYRDGNRNVGEVLALMHSELSEALEEWRDGHPLNETRIRADGKPEGFPSELADVVIRILDTCEREGINLEAEVIRKMDYNATRPYRHGGKLA